MTSCTLFWVLTDISQRNFPKDLAQDVFFQSPPWLVYAVGDWYPMGNAQTALNIVIITYYKTEYDLSSYKFY